MQLQFREQMSGSFYDTRLEEKHFSFDMVATSVPGSITKFSLSGKIFLNEVSYDGVGSLELNYFSTHTIEYKIEFSDFVFVGKKRDIQLWNVWRTHFVLYGDVFNRDNGKLVYSGVCKFQYKDIPKMLMSFRVV